MAAKIKIQGSMTLGDTGNRIKGMQTMLAGYGSPQRTVFTGMTASMPNNI